MLERPVGWAIKTGVRGVARAFAGPESLGEPLVPKPRNPDPVVLLNGFSCDNEMFAPWTRSLQRDGFDVYVAKLPNNALGDIPASARYVSNFIDGVKEKTGAKKVDVVGYSEGGLVARTYTKLLGGAANVDSQVHVGTPNNGVVHPVLDQVLDKVPFVRSAIPDAGEQMFKGSDLMKQLNNGKREPGIKRITSMYAEDLDGIVFPSRSPVLQGANNIALNGNDWLPFLDGPNHLAMIQSSEQAYLVARAALATPRNKRPPTSLPERY